jgi:hypothetical protein
MSNTDWLYQATGVTSETKVEIPFGPWVVWGQPVRQFLRQNPFPTERKGLTYSAYVRFVRDAKGAERIQDASRPESFASGDSLVQLEPGLDFITRVMVDGRSYDVNVHRNDLDRLAYAEIELIQANDAQSVINLARLCANSIAWSLSFATHVPLYWDTVMVKSSDNAEHIIEMLSPTPLTPVAQPDPTWLHPSLRPFASLYADGLRSNSPFYQFLCFFKVCQRINASVRPKLRKLFVTRALPPPELNGIFPGDPINVIAKDMVGVKYTVAITKYQVEYRNAVAHFDPADKLEPFDLTVEARVRTAAILMSWAAYDLLGQMTDAVKALRAAGADDAAITFS